MVLEVTPHLAVGRLDTKGQRSSTTNARRTGPESHVVAPIEYRYTGAGCVGPWCASAHEAAQTFDELWARRLSS